MISRKSEFKFCDRGFKDNLVLIPGWATDYRIFTTLDLNYNYLLPIRFTPANFSEDLLEQLNKLSLEQTSLLGWSLGGFLASDFARRYPKRIDTLVLLSIRQRFNAQALKEAQKGIKEDKRAYLYKFYLNGFSGDDREGLSWFKRHLLKYYLNEMHLENLILGLDYLAGAQINPDSLARIKRIRIFHGTDDKIAPLEESYVIKSELPQAEFVFLHKLGHILFLNQRFKEKFYNG